MVELQERVRVLERATIYFEFGSVECHPAGIRSIRLTSVESAYETAHFTSSFQIYERIAIEKLTCSPSSGILFLQLTVEDMGICVPLNPLPPVKYKRSPHRFSAVCFPHFWYIFFPD